MRRVLGDLAFEVDAQTRLELALAVSATAQGTYYRDSAGERVIEESVPLTEVVRSFRPFEVRLNPEILAIESSGLLQNPALDDISLLLLAHNICPILQTSGSTEHGLTLYAQVGDASLKNHLTCLARQAGLVVGTPRCAPPMTPHILQRFPVHLLSPATTAEALDVLAATTAVRPALTGILCDLILGGTDNTSGFNQHELLEMVVTGMVNCGWGVEDCLSVLLDDRFAIHSTVLEVHLVRATASLWLHQAWATAAAFVDEYPCRTSEVRTIDRYRSWALLRRWSGPHAVLDQVVYLALLDRATDAGSSHCPLSLADLDQCGQIGKVQSRVPESLQRLKRRGLLKVVADASWNSPISTYRLLTPGDHSHRTPGFDYLPPSVAVRQSMARAALAVT